MSNFASRLKALERAIRKHGVGPCRHCGAGRQGKPSLAEGYARLGFEAVSTPTDDLGRFLAGLAQHEREQLVASALSALRCGKCKRISANGWGPEEMLRDWVTHGALTPAEAQAANGAYLAHLVSILEAA